MPAVTTIPVPAIDETDAAVEPLKFLGNGSRLRILQILSQHESCVCALNEHLKLPQPLLSYHLRRLREVGLVRPRRKAQWIYYSIEPVGPGANQRPQRPQLWLVSSPWRV